MKLCPACQAEFSDGVRYCPKDGAGLVPVSDASTGTLALYDALIGETLESRYRVEGPLGEGALARVYSGIHLMIEKPVALKVLKADFLKDESIVRRFLQEAKAASGLSHRNIVSISDFGTTPQGCPFFVMDRLVGPTLGDLLSQGASLPVEQTLRIAEGIAAGLAEAHRHGIIHRDLKPDNVLLVTEKDGDQVVKLVDFGLAQVSSAAQRITRSGQVLGTPEHMAPEQVAGKPVDPRADVFALGILVYRMLSGKLPFTGASAVETVTRLLDASPDPLPSRSKDGRSLEAMAPVILWSLALDPADRPSSATEFVEALREACQAPAEAAPPSAKAEPVARVVPADSLTQETQIAVGLLERGRRRKARWRRHVWSVLLAILAILAGVFLGSRLLSGTPAARDVSSAADTGTLNMGPGQGIEKRAPWEAAVRLGLETTEPGQGRE